MEIDLNEAVQTWTLVCLWFLAGGAGLGIAILMYLWALGR